MISVVQSSSDNSGTGARISTCSQIEAEWRVGQRGGRGRAPHGELGSAAHLTSVRVERRVMSASVHVWGCWRLSARWSSRWNDGGVWKEDRLQTGGVYRLQRGPWVYRRQRVSSGSVYRWCLVYRPLCFGDVWSSPPSQLSHWWL